MDGTIFCYQGGQIITIIFLAVWILPFPIYVSIGYLHLRHQRIPLWKFALGLILPIPILVNILYIRIKEILQTSNQTVHPLAPKMRYRLMEIFEEPYKESYYWWESWRLIERFIISMLSVFLINPVSKTFYIMPVLVCVLYFHYTMDPFKDSMHLLRRLDLVSYFCLCIQMMFNVMRSVAYIYSLGHDDLMISIETMCGYLEHIVSPLSYLLIYFVVKKTYDKVKQGLNILKHRILAFVVIKLILDQKIIFYCN